LGMTLFLVTNEQRSGSSIN